MKKNLIYRLKNKYCFYGSKYINKWKLLTYIIIIYIIKLSLYEIIF